MDESVLPEGWTLARIREVSQSPAAELWPTTVRVFLETYPPGESASPVRTRIEPESIIRFEYMVLVRGVDDPDWYMGQVHDGDVDCWGSYGPDLEAAIRAM